MIISEAEVFRRKKSNPPNQTTCFFFIVNETLEVQHCFQIKGSAGFSFSSFSIWTIELSFFVVFHVLKLGPVLGAVHRNLNKL